METDEIARLPLAEGGRGWIENRKSEIAKDTYDMYVENLATLVRFFGTKKLPEITPNNVRDYQDWRKKQQYRGKPLTPNTINKECNMLCQMRKYIGMGFTKGEYKAIRKKKSKIGRSLSDVERTHLLHMAKVMARTNECWEAIYYFAKFALNTGAGPKEVAGVQLSDIFISEQGNMVHVRGTKTEGRDRMVPLNEEALEAVIEARDRLRRLTGGITNPDFYLFPRLVQKNKTYDPTRPQVCFRRAWENLRKAAGLPTLRMYDMRHDFITRLLSDKKTSDQVVEEVVGHLTADQKKDYSHQRMEDKQEAVNRILRKRVAQYTKKPAQSVAIDPELVAQIASAVSIALAQMQKK